MPAFKSRAPMRHSRPQGFRKSSSVTPQQGVEVPLVFDRLPPFIGHRTTQSLIPYKPAPTHTRMAHSYSDTVPPVTHASRATQTEPVTYASRVTQTERVVLADAEPPPVAEPAPPKLDLYDAPGVLPSVYARATAVAVPAPAPDEQAAPKKALYVSVNPPRDFNLPSPYYTPILPNPEARRKAEARWAEEERIKKQREAAERKIMEAEAEAGAPFCRRCCGLLINNKCATEFCPLFLSDGRLYVGYSR